MSGLSEVCIMNSNTMLVWQVWTASASNVHLSFNGKHVKKKIVFSVKGFISSWIICDITKSVSILVLNS